MTTRIYQTRSSSPAATLLLTVLFAVPAVSVAADKGNAAMVERGRLLVTVGSCNDCHTPWKMTEKGPAPDTSRMLSGHPEGAPDPDSALAEGDIAIIGPTFTSFRLPFGVTYAYNLTPDKETGLGNWTEDTFVRALQTGKHMGGEGRIIMPPMPWPFVGALEVNDLKAIFAYLQTIPAVKNAVSAHKVPAEVVEGMTKGHAQQTAAMIAAKAPRHPLPVPAATGDTARDARIARGRTLVTIGGCNDCHTPWKANAAGVPEPDLSRMLMGHPADAADPASAYKGNDVGIIGPTFTAFTLPFGTVYAPNLTPDADTGLGKWSKEQFITTMRSGISAKSAERGILPPMPWTALAQASDADLTAIWEYLRVVPAIRNQAPAAKVPAEVIAQVASGNKAMTLAMKNGKKK
jgi:mono/diheme cytochrome c family protein